MRALKYQALFGVLNNVTLKRYINNTEKLYAVINWKNLIVPTAVKNS